MKLTEAKVPWSPRRHHRSSVDPWKRQRCRELRRAATRSEQTLWQQLRRCGAGIKFRRQHLLFGWIVDFFAPALGLAVECDGPVHDRERDQHRDAELSRLGVTTIRLENQEVLNDTAACVAAITDVAERLKEQKGLVGVGQP
jgi:very-short-patch-repair endonuclease